MAILTKQFHQHERGAGNEDCYSLARDTETGRVFVHHEWSHRKGKSFRTGEEGIEIGAFLIRGGGTRHAKLLDLIGTLVKDDDDPKGPS